MGGNGVARVAGNLDPRAQEFRPAAYYPIQHHHNHHHRQLFYYPSPHHNPELNYPPPPPPPPPPASILPRTVGSPTRAILLSSVPTHVSESEVRHVLEVFGEVRAVEMERVREGVVTVHFYDLRAAHAALDAVRDQHMQHQQRLQIHYSSYLAPNTYLLPPIGLPCPPPPAPPPSPGIISGRAVWAQFAVPVTNAFPDGDNQGSIVIFNLDPNTSAFTLNNIFQAFGAVKETRETPMKQQHKFVEFFDVRDASRALSEMNGKEINGRNVIIKFSLPGGNCKHHLNDISPKQFQPSKPRLPPLATAPLPLRNRRLRVLTTQRRSTSSKESVERAMSGLRLEEEERESSKKEGKKNNGGDCSSSSGGGVRVITKERKGGKPRKETAKKLDPRFMIMEGAIKGCRDTRTTVMIKNIPNKYSQKLVLNMLDNHCIHCNEKIGEEDDRQPLSSYDFVYLPIDFNNRCNVGYGFVNMTSPEATLRLYKAFHNLHWEVFSSRKICEVTYARVQGLEALKEHFKNSKFACQRDEYLPVEFSPPRDGRQLSAPVPIVFPPSAPSATLLTSSSSELLQQHHINTVLRDPDDDNSDGSVGWEI